MNNKGAESDLSLQRCSCNCFRVQGTKAIIIHIKYYMPGINNEISSTSVKYNLCIPTSHPTGQEHEKFSKK